MKVFEVRNGVNHYQYFLPGQEEGIIALHMNGI